MSRTLAEYWPEFLELCELKRLTNATIRGYRKEWSNRVGPRFGNYLIQDIRFGDIQRFVLTLTRTQAKHSVALLRVMINSAIDDGYAETNPLDKRRVRYPSLSTSLPHTWSGAEVMQACDILHGSKIEPLYLCLIGGGLRVEESLALKWSDIVVCDCYVSLRIDDAWTEADGTKTTKNAYSTRLVPIGEPFSARLVELRRTTAQDARIWPDYPRLASRYWSILFDPCMPLHALQPVKLKDMRSIHETLMQESGVLDTVNARLHGRTNISTGYRFYLKPNKAVSDASIQLSNYLRDVYNAEKQKRI